MTVGIGANARSGTTDSTGRVTATIPILSAPGTYPITVSFTGDGGYLASAVSGSLTVTQAATTLSPLTSGVGVVALTSTIGGKTQPLMQETVRISVTGSQGNVDVYVTTDYLGRAVFPPPGFAPGTYTLNTAYFDGNATYSPSPPLALNVSTPSYDFAGFYAPVVNQPAVNVVKAGSSVAVKFSLGGNRGLQVFAAGFPASVACPGSSSSTAFQQTVNPGASSLQYDSATGQYSYIWKTDKAWTGTCRNLVLKFIDGTQRSASFQFKD